MVVLIMDTVRGKVTSFFFVEKLPVHPFASGGRGSFAGVGQVWKCGYWSHPPLCGRFAFKMV